MFELLQDYDLQTLLLWLEGIGLGLAVLDFFRISKLLEIALDRARRALEPYVRRPKVGRTWRGVHGLIATLSAMVLVPFAFYVAYVSPQDGYWKWALAFVVSVLVSVLIGAIAALPIILIQLLLSVLWWFLHLCNLPRAGTIGTIGLLLAVLSFSGNLLL